MREPLYDACMPLEFSIIMHVRHFDEFVADNVVLLYRTRGRGIVPDVGEVFTSRTRRAKRR